MILFDIRRSNKEILNISRKAQLSHKIGSNYSRHQLSTGYHRFLPILRRPSSNDYLPKFKNSTTSLSRSYIQPDTKC